VTESVVWFEATGPSAGRAAAAGPGHRPARYRPRVPAHRAPVHRPTALARRRPRL